MGREIFIVARDRPHLYRYLSQTFADATNVQVILDRRSAESPGSAPDSARCRAERRTRADIAEQLQTVGYAFITID